MSSPKQLTTLEYMTYLAQRNITLSTGTLSAAFQSSLQNVLAKL